MAAKRRKSETSPAVLAAFDLLIKVMEEKGKKSVNLRDIMFNAAASADDATKAFEAGKQAMERTNATREAQREVVAVPRPEDIDMDSLTLGQLDMELSLKELIEFRRSLER